MAAPARPAAASVSGSFALPPDARCSFDQPRRREGLQDDRMVRTLVYTQPESYPKDAVVAAVEECMRRQAEGLLHSLDGIGGRLSQLELYCYKLERSIGELRSDVMDYHSEATVNFRCIEKNLRQVQKAVQILQDRQDFADAPKELAKLQIPHEISAQRSEATASSVLGARENGPDAHIAKHEVTLLPLHQVNGMQSHAVQVQTSNGYVLQHLVPVSLGTQHDQQQVNQAPVYYAQNQDHAKSSESKRVESVVQVVQHDQQQMNHAPVYYVQSQDHAKSTESKPVDSAVQVVQPLVHNPEARVAGELPQKSSQPTELYPQAQSHRLQVPAQQVDSHAWPSQQSMVQQQQYIIHQVSRQMAQQQSSSPQSQSAPQGTPLYPAYSSQKPASSNTEPISRSVALQPSYSSPQQKHHEVVHSFYGQPNTILLPVADHNIQQQQPQSIQQQQPQSLQQQQPQSLQQQPPQSKPNHCSVASYSVQGNVQTYSSTYKNPSNCPAAIAVVPQPPATPMAFHHLGPQVLQNHPFGNIVETASVVGYPRDRVETFPVVTAAQPIDSSVLVDKLNAGSNVTSPRDWAS
ncbi:hypothetical protein PR202_gb05227 [Eleusine coracana subsp. coracana]|uniref:DUF1421 domain-containing protein n=1 Tax=Eleusine coracana subsp. coracana TaxID=191504 RepID=A0AAV5E6P6_ELECO|nr:hypothetical protein PR202_gb05227 [Eleusine coracana subsp. coracana]